MDLALAEKNPLNKLRSLISSDPLEAQLIAARPAVDASLVDPLLKLKDARVRE
jgi:hypothetical protein